MRIAFVSTSKSWGGGEQLLAHLLLGIQRAGHEVGLATRRHGGAARWARQVELPLVLEFSGMGRMPRSLLSLRGWLGKHQFDVLVLNDPHAITCGGLASWRMPLVRVGIRHTVFPIRSAWKHRRLVDHVACVSQPARQECVRVGLPPERISVIHCGVPVARVELDAARAVERLFAGVSRGNAPRHLLGVGSLLTVKGFDATIKALASAVRDGKNWCLWIAGEGDLRPTLEALARLLGVADRVHLLGFRRDVAALMASADVFVSASHSEGLPLVLVEAMQMGCPIVSTPVGGCAEALQAGQNMESPLAEIVAPGDVAGLAAAIDRALQHHGPASRRVAAARKWALEAFSLKGMVERHLALYSRLITESGDDPSARLARRAA